MEQLMMGVPEKLGWIMRPGRGICGNESISD